MTDAPPDEPRTPAEPRIETDVASVAEPRSDVQAVAEPAGDVQAAGEPASEVQASAEPAGDVRPAAEAAGDVQITAESVSDVQAAAELAGDVQAAADAAIAGLSAGLGPEQTALALAVLANRAVTRLHALGRTEAAARKGQPEWPVWAQLQNASRSLVLQASTCRTLAARLAGRSR
jgi:hypothetical protein